MIQLKTFTFNPVAVNAYLLWDETREAVLIDPACFYPEEEKELSSFVEEMKLSLKFILNTHGHFDHLMGNAFAAGKWGMDCLIHSGDIPLVEMAFQQSKMFGMTMKNPPIPSRTFIEGESFYFGTSMLKVIHVPGHSPGGVAFYSADDKILIPGDILFEGSVGRTDLPGGNHYQLIKGIQEKLMVLNEEVRVYPGHGSETTIGKEKRDNPFLQ
jgi:glyoxylase-like metal-dependent hydrolase (beta-lactamase superfamily II)